MINSDPGCPVHTKPLEKYVKGFEKKKKRNRNFLVSETEGSKQVTIKPNTGNDPDLVPSIYNLQILPKVHLRLVLSSPPPSKR
jgi:hypothetical protein